MQKSIIVFGIVTVLSIVGCRSTSSFNESSAAVNIVNRDKLIREKARMELVKSGSQNAVNIIGKVFQNTSDNNWKLALINGLGEIKKPDIIQWLIPLPDERGLADAAVKALSGLALPETTEAIEEYYQMYKTVAGAFAMLNEAEALRAKDAQSEKATEIFTVLFQNSGIQAVRTAVLMHLLLDECKANEQNEAILAKLPLPENEYCLNSVLAKWLETGCKCGGMFLRKNDGPATLFHGKECLYYYFAKNYESFASSSKALILSNLGNSQDTQFISLARKELNSPDEQIRIAALNALETLGDASDMKAILEATADKSVNVQAAAAMLIRRVYWDGVDDFLAEALKGNDCKLTCIRALKDRRCSDFNSVILAEASNSDDKVAIAALDALGVLAKNDDANSMTALLRDGYVHFKQAAEAIRKSCTKEPDNNLSWTTALETALSRTSGDNQKTVYSILAAIGNQDSFEVLAKHKDNPHVLELLCNWRNIKQEKAILELAENLNDPFAHARLIGGIINAYGKNKDIDTKKKAEQLLSYLPKCERKVEQKLVFDYIADIPDMSAFRKLESFIDNDDYKEYAISALAKNATLYGPEKMEVLQASLKTAMSKTEGNLYEELKGAMVKVTAPFGFITKWRYSQAFTAKNDKGVDNCLSAHQTIFNPEKPEFNLENVPWPKYTASKSDKHPNCVELHRCLGGVQRTAYILAWIEADQDMDARLELGSDDMLKTWMNGEMILDLPKYQALVAGNIVVNIKLKKGRNSLLMKISQGSNDWEACAAIKDLDGSLLQGWTDKY